MSANERILFVTGHLAESPLREVLAVSAEGADWSWDVAVLGVSVAALLHTDLVARRLELSGGIDRIVLPGWWLARSGCEKLSQGRWAEADQKYDLPMGKCWPPGSSVVTGLGSVRLGVVFRDPQLHVGRSLPLEMASTYWLLRRPSGLPV